MEIKRVLNIEDDIIKHMAISRALTEIGIAFVDHASNAEDGLGKLIYASKHERYELLILDMNFSINGIENSEAGMYILKKIKERQIDIPVIICSSMRLVVPEVMGCVYYNKTRDLYSDLREMIEKIERMK